MVYIFQRQLEASFFRGGTSRGLIMSQYSLMPYPQQNRERILCAAMGSPDPDGRQIGGLGGGTSSTSKVCIVNNSKFHAEQRQKIAKIHPFPGLPWLDEDVARVEQISDIVYRAGQVPVNGDKIDWGATCGNMMAAVALHGAIDNAHVYGRPFHFGDLNKWVHAINNVSDLAEAEQMLENRSVVVRILAHDTGKVFRASLPVAPRRVHRGIRHSKNPSMWFPKLVGTFKTAGVPGTGAPITIEAPVDGDVLITGNERDSIEVDGVKLEVSVVDVGLPVVIVHADSIGFSASDLLQHPAEIDNNRPLMEKLERIRQAACALTPKLQSKLSLATPKICVVKEPTAYSTTGKDPIEAKDMDILARTVSSGQLHRTIPATTLSALAAAHCFPNSIVSQIVKQNANGLADVTRSWAESVKPSQHQVSFDGEPIEVDNSSSSGRVALSIGHPAGIATAGVATSPSSDNGASIPTSIVMQRTAQRIWTGNIWVPADIHPTREARDIQNTITSNRRVVAQWTL